MDVHSVMLMGAVTTMDIQDYEQKLMADKSIGKKKREKMLAKEEKRREREVGIVDSSWWLRLW